MSIIIMIVLLIFCLPFAVVGFLLYELFFKKQKTKNLQAKENNKSNGGPIGPTNVSDINKDVNVTYSFCELQMDQFLRKKYKNLRQWRSLGRPVGYQFNGKHFLELTFWNGSVQTIWITAKIDLDIKIFEADPEKVISPEEEAEQWISNWKSFLLEKYNRKEGFLIQTKDLPSSNEIVDLILDRLTGSGNFSAVSTPEGIRCTVE